MLKLKSSTTGTSSRVSRSPEFKATVLALMASGMSARDALADGCNQFDLPVNASYEKHPHTFIGQFRTSIAAIVENEGHASHNSVVTILRDADLIDDTDDSDNIDNIDD